MKRTSFTQKALKFFKIFFITLIAFILILFLIGKLAEKKITRIAFNQLKESIKVPIEAGDISFTLIKRFPLATIEFKDIRVSSLFRTTTADSGRLNSDTLINIKRLYISVKSTPLIDGIFDIQKVEIIGANIDYTIDKTGISNFNFLADTTNSEKQDTASYSPLDLTLQELLLIDITCYYSDSITTTKAKITVPEITVKGRIKDDIYSGYMDGSVLISECDFKESYLDRMRETKIDFEIGFKNDSIKIDDFSLVTDGALLKASGVAMINDEIYSDIRIKGENINLAELIKYMPKDSLEKYNIKNIDGSMSFNATINGAISDSLQPHIDMSISMRSGNVETFSYATLKNISFDAFVTNGVLQNEQTTKIDVNNLHFETGNSKGDISLSLENLNHPEYIFKSDLNLNISDFRSLIPDSLIQTISGNIQAHLFTKGVLPDSINSDFIEYMLHTSRAKVMFSNFNITMDSLPPVKSFSGIFNYSPGQFDANMLNVSIPDYHVNIKNSSFNTLLSGKLTRPEETTVDVKSFVFNTDSSRISGSAFIQNLTAPIYKLNSEITLNLSEIKNMLPDSIVNELSGEVISTITSTGEINPDSISEQINDIIFKKSSFIVNLNRVSVKMPDTLICVKNLSGRLKIVPDTIIIDELNGVYENIDFNASSVKIVNLYNSVVKNMHEQLYVEGAFHFGDIDYAAFAPFMDSTSLIASTDVTLDTSNPSPSPETSPSLTDTTAINYTFLIKGKLAVNSILYDKAQIMNISAHFNIKDSLYIVDQLTFDGFKGKMNSSLRVEFNDNGEMQINTKHFVEGMDVKQILEDFDDFSKYGNTYIESNNLSGTLSTELYTQSVLIDDSLLMNRTRVKGTFKIENGGIFNYKPAIDMAEVTKLKELDNIKFKTLESEIFMFKNKLYVPKTNIVSSALDVSLFGMQSMDDDYEYHVDLRLRDVLKGKNEKLFKRQAATGEEITDEDMKRGSVKLIYAYMDGKSKVGFDSKKAQRMMQLKIKVQQKMLDLIFNPKIVSFDTGIK